MVVRQEKGMCQQEKITLVAGGGREPSHGEWWVAAKLFAPAGARAATRTECAADAFIPQNFVARQARSTMRFAGSENYASQIVGETPYFLPYFSNIYRAMGRASGKWISTSDKLLIICRRWPEQQ